MVGDAAAHVFGELGVEVGDVVAVEHLGAVADQNDARARGIMPGQRTRERTLPRAVDTEDGDGERERVRVRHGEPPGTVRLYIRGRALYIRG